jgi:hypothetical protein
MSGYILLIFNFVDLNIENRQKIDSTKSRYVKTEEQNFLCFFILTTSQ